MTDYSWRRSLLMLVVAVVAVFCAVRGVVGLWSWLRAPDEFQSYVAFNWVVGTVLGGLVLLAAGLGGITLMVATRRRDRETARRDRLAELGLLSGGLAHEIRNNLNAMQAHISLARKQTERQPDSPTAAQLAKLERAVQELEELTTNFLAFARPAKDNLNEVDLRQMIPEVLDFVALDLERGKVNVTVDLAAEVPTVYVDVIKFKRALLNLIVNARQAMPEGGRLTVRAAPLKGHRVLLEVSDTGHGIADAERAKIFQTFFSTKPDGTGLGLAVVKRTVEDCGGQVSFESQQGKGTTFRIVLPIARRRRFDVRRGLRRFRRAS